MLEVRLLGQFEVRLEGALVEMPSRPAQTLFAYLVLNAGVAQRRERLAGLFWPDSSEEKARRNLRQA
jgi:DNA-binding SARP family transcriptional activator